MPYIRLVLVKAQRFCLYKSSFHVNSFGEHCFAREDRVRFTLTSVRPYYYIQIYQLGFNSRSGMIVVHI